MNCKRMALTAALLLALPLVASAAVPYTSYTYDSYGNAVTTSHIYEPASVLSGQDMKAGQLTEPRDMSLSPSGELYILDSGNGRVIVLDRQLRLNRIVDTFTSNGETTELDKPTGLFVDGNGNLYIAAPGNQRVLCTDGEGRVLADIRKPESEYFSEYVEFLPQKLVRDRAGNLYVQCTGIYQGLVIFDAQYAFQGFFASEKVVTTAETIRDYFWKQMMTEEQKEIMAGYVPQEIYNMDITSEDFIYTVSTAQLVPGDTVKMEMDSLCCLNPKGGDTIIRKMPDTAYNALEMDARQLNFVDVCYDENGFLNVLDDRKGKIYQFDQNMQLVCAFGALGEYAGTFSKPVAIETMNDCILVLDQDKGSLTVFRTTRIGANVHEALKLYYAGDYKAAVEPWKQVIAENANYELAYIGIGSALYNQQQYDEALTYFQLGRDSARYSEAFKEYRVALMRKNIVWIVAAVVAIVLVPPVIRRIWRKRKADGVK